MKEVKFEIDKAEEHGMTAVWAKDLRIKENLQTIPDDKPGWYRWWAPTEALELLRITPEYIAHLYKRILNDEYFYCIYVGIAVKESIRARINWHVNQQHTESAVQSGTLSTFRQSISSLVAENQFDENSTNKLIDMLIVEYYAVDYKIKSEEAKTEIERTEQNELSAEYALPLNIQGNKNTVIQPYLSILKELRSKSKQPKIVEEKKKDAEEEYEEKHYYSYDKAIDIVGITLDLRSIFDPYTWLQQIFKHNKGIDFIIAHEMTHTQQPDGDAENDGKSNLLGYCVNEGAADFIAELLLQQPLTNPYIIYGKQYEKELWQKFQQEMYGQNVDNWLYHGSNDSFPCYDLGYFEGYAICKSYYEHAKNKKQAIFNIINLERKNTDALNRFLKQSKYGIQWQ